MTDAVSFYRNVITQVTQFVNAFESLELLSDRIGADSSLAGLAAAAASAGGRSDLATADFNNVKAAIDLLTATLDSNSVSVNTATVKLAFYKML